MDEQLKDKFMREWLHLEERKRVSLHGLVCVSPSLFLMGKIGLIPEPFLEAVGRIPGDLTQ